MASSAINNNNVILVADRDCAIAIMYERKFRNVGIFKDTLGQTYTAFEYSDALEACIDAYETGHFRVTVPGYLEYHEATADEYEQEAAEIGKHTLEADQ